MKAPLLIACLALWTSQMFAVELEAITHRVIADERLFVRDATDRRYSVWTNSTETASELLEKFGLKAGNLELRQGQILVLFLNDRITEDLTQLMHNKTTDQIFADYADSGIEFKLGRLPGNKKRTHLTAVIFQPPHTPSHVGMRRMVSDGLSEKQ